MNSPSSGYILIVLRLIRENRGFFLGATLLALALRLFFFAYFPAVVDDSRVYADIASNWLQHGIYGQTQTTDGIIQLVPSDTRLPGYPAFLVAIFSIFGIGNFKAVLLIQILFDLATCFLIADLARRISSDRAARFAFGLAAICPFLANYASAALTETLEVFFTALALNCCVAALQSMKQTAPTFLGRTPDAHPDRSRFILWSCAGAAIGTCILLRPDGGILLASLVVYLLLTRAHISLVGRISVAVLVSSCALLPLVPWTIRNFRTLHHFQPLAPRYANEVDELAPRGFNRWAKTWIIDYASVEEIYWDVPGDKIDAGKLPTRAFDSTTQQDATLALIAEYNENADLTPELDARFAELAADRIHAHRVRYYIVLPALRIADMWLRPRTELLPPDVRWWEFKDDPSKLALDIGFGLLNLAYLGAGLWVLVRQPSQATAIGLLVCFVLLRSAFLGTLENPEPRYTLECYPAVIVLASAFGKTDLGRKLRTR